VACSPDYCKTKKKRFFEEFRKKKKKEFRSLPPFLSPSHNDRTLRNACHRAAQKQTHVHAFTAITTSTMSATTATAPAAADARGNDADDASRLTHLKRAVVLGVLNNSKGGALGRGPSAGAIAKLAADLGDTVERVTGWLNCARSKARALRKEREEKEARELSATEAAASNSFRFTYDHPLTVADKRSQLAFWRQRGIGARAEAASRAGKAAAKAAAKAKEVVEARGSAKHPFSLFSFLPPFDSCIKNDPTLPLGTDPQTPFIIILLSPTHPLTHITLQRLSLPGVRHGPHWLSSIIGVLHVNAAKPRSAPSRRRREGSPASEPRRRITHAPRTLIFRRRRTAVRCEQP
jgi:hypothetical protein